jgi:hypothetical protein
MFRIDKNVKMSDRSGPNYKYGKPAPGRSIYPFKDMEVGDSVFFDGEPKGGRSNPSVSSRIYGAKTGKKFSSSREGEGVRVWRVE